MFVNAKNISKFFFIASLILLFFTVINLLSCLNVNTTVAHDNSNIVAQGYNKEEFSAEISSITSLSDFKFMIKRKVDAGNIRGIDIPILIDDYVRKKFFHRTSYQSSCENWILNVLDTIFPQYFLTVSLNPNDIMLNSFAACNQQSIIFQDVVKDYDLEYGSVGFYAIKFKHFANAVKVKDKWYFFDPNLEPKYDRSDPSIFNAVIAADKKVLESMYRDKINDDIVSLEYIKSDSVRLRDINKNPAKNGLLIQNITKIISWYGWIFLLLVSMLFYIFEKINIYRRL